MEEDKRDSYVSFLIRSRLKGRAYKGFIINLLGDFIEQFNPREDHRWKWANEIALSPWNGESGLACFKIKETYISHIKMYLFDENRPVYERELSRRIIFRDHYSKYDVEKIYLVADAFEDFLKSRELRYIRENRMR
jgi:hypothetical protein